MPTTAQICEAAATRGRTRIVDMSSCSGELILRVKPDEDLDDEFGATCAATGESLREKGLLLPLQDDAQRWAELQAKFGAAA